MSQDPNEVYLRWEGGERFSGSAGGAAITLDGAADDVASPTQALAAGLAGCMAIDVAMILEKGRQKLERLEVRLRGERAQEPPRRFLRFRLDFEIFGEVEPSRVERAIALSRETYCSVWHTLRSDIDLETSFEILSPE